VAAVLRVTVVPVTFVTVVPTAMPVPETELPTTTEEASVTSLTSSSPDMVLPVVVTDPNTEPPTTTDEASVTVTVVLPEVVEPVVVTEDDTKLPTVTEVASVTESTVLPDEMDTPVLVTSLPLPEVTALLKTTLVNVRSSLVLVVVAAVSSVTKLPETIATVVPVAMPSPETQLPTTIPEVAEVDMAT